MARIALDAMGGDFAPDAAIAGALQAILELGPEHTLQLVGPTNVIRERVSALSTGDLAPAAALADKLEIVEAPDVIEMSDKPAAALRSKPNSSMVVGLRLQTGAQHQNRHQQHALRQPGAGHGHQRRQGARRHHPG